MGMSYSVIAFATCDKCGKEKSNTDFCGHESLDRYGRRVTGYVKIGKGWFCPDCAKNKKVEKGDII